ncbi:MAG: hypothetical protein [Arizlama microvirus]|nr:MAG: hypothetical protein [Arizlama microvirus]
MKRHKMNYKKSKRMFTKGARRVHNKNSLNVSRGGIRL